MFLSTKQPLLRTPSIFPPWKDKSLLEWHLHIAELVRNWQKCLTHLWYSLKLLPLVLIKRKVTVYMWHLEREYFFLSLSSLFSIKGNENHLCFDEASSCLPQLQCPFGLTASVVINQNGHLIVLSAFLKFRWWLLHLDVPCHNNRPTLESPLHCSFSPCPSHRLCSDSRAETKVSSKDQSLGY